MAQPCPPQWTHPQTCRIGPVPIPPRPADALAGDPAVLARCAQVLSALRPPGGPRAVRIRHGGREHAAPADAPPLTIDVLDAGATVTTGPDEITARRWAAWFLRTLTEVLGEVAPPPADGDGHVVLAPFAAQVDRTPDAVAVRDEQGRSLTYRELFAAENRLAHHLVALGATRGSRVGIAVPRGVDQVVAIHAAVAAGAVYVPLDTELPAARLRYIAEDAGVEVVLTGGAEARALLGPTAHLVDVERDTAAWRDRPARPPAVATPPGALLHILYTSGTTGRPKGVAYPAHGVADHLVAMQARYPFLPGDTALAKTSPGFDVSVWELFWPFHHGARLVTCRPGGHSDPAHLARLVDRHAVTTIFLPPTVMAPFLAKAPSALPALRWALCGGEPVGPRVRDLFHATAPGAEIANCYGPTEAGGVTDGLLARSPGAPVPLGRPQPHFRIHLLDEELRPVPAGTPGEAYIGSRTGIADCYWRAPARTAERFVADPYGAPGARLYRTGDLLRRAADGTLTHLGRIDRQLKIGGMRIEPGEIESVLAEDPRVADSAVLADGDPPRLVAFVVPPDPGDVPGVDVDGIAGHAATLLPAHMRPAEIVPVAAIPANVNGKVDREALLALAAAHRTRTASGAAEGDGPEEGDGMERALAELVGHVLGAGPVRLSDTFLSLGGTSLTAAELLEQCERRFAATPDVRVLLGGTLREVADALRVAAGAA